MWYVVVEIFGGGGEMRKYFFTLGGESERKKLRSMGFEQYLLLHMYETVVLLKLSKNHTTLCLLNQRTNYVI